MCFQSDKSFTRKPFMGMMDIGFYREVVDEIAKGGTGALTLASRGEPTMHPDLPEMLHHAGEQFFEFKLTINATRLDDALCHAILSSGVNIIVFSVDANSKELYERIRLRGNFDEVYANIARFHDIREKHYPDSRLSTRISAVRFRDDQNPVEFREFWSPIVDEVSMKDAQLRWDTYANPVDQDKVSPCRLLWELLYVWFDGTTNPCDLDYKSYLSPGNVRDRGIAEIWHGPELTAMREAHATGARTELNPCDRCGWV
jgi:hypothetical protein